MLCPNCNNSLNGSESFCPHCGQAIKKQENKNDKPPLNFQISEIPEEEGQCSIFDSESITLPDEDTSGKKASGRNKIAIGLVSLFVLILVAIAGFTALEYFDLSPAISSLTFQQTTNSLESHTKSELDGSEGLLPPEINYKPLVCTVSSQKALPLRKGPGDSYALISSVSQGVRLQITGGCIDNDIWVYVYIPSDDIYGWLNASYLTCDGTMESTTLFSQEDKTESTTADSTEKEKEKEPIDADNNKEKSDVPQDSYTAKVTAEKGLYLRVGPGTDFEALTVIGKGESVKVIEICKSNPKWILVEFKNQKGYVSGDFIAKA